MPHLPVSYLPTRTQDLCGSVSGVPGGPLLHRLDGQAGSRRRLHIFARRFAPGM